MDWRLKQNRRSASDPEGHISIFPQTLPNTLPELLLLRLLGDIEHCTFAPCAAARIGSRSRGFFALELIPAAVETLHLGAGLFEFIPERRQSIRAG